MAYRNRIALFSYFLILGLNDSWALGGVTRNLLPPLSIPVVRYRLAQKYFDQIESISKIPFTQLQQENLTTYLAELSPYPHAPSKVKGYRSAYFLWKTKLIADWVHHHNRPWPSVIKNIGGVYRPILWEVHHIFHLSNGGPNEFWNIHPLDKEMHRKIHGKGEPGETLHGKGIIEKESFDGFFFEIEEELKNPHFDPIFRP